MGQDFYQIYRLFSGGQYLLVWCGVLQSKLQIYSFETLADSEMPTVSTMLRDKAENIPTYLSKPIEMGWS
jgi:hypothetical protein